MRSRADTPTWTPPTLADKQTLVALFQAGRFEDCAAEAHRFTERHPNDGFGWKVRGSVLALLKRASEALPALQRARTLTPRDPEIHNALGVTLGRLGQLEAAVATYRTALGLKPDYAEAHNNLATAFKDLGRLREAEAECRQALALNPHYVEAHSNLGNVFKLLGRFDDAEAAYRRSLALQPDYAEAHNNLSTALKELNRLSEAEACCRRALALQPDCAEAHHNLGSILKELNRLSEAEVCCRRALALQPDCAEAHTQLGSVLTALNRLPEAEAGFRRALELRPADATSYSNLLFAIAYTGHHPPERIRREAEGWERAILSTAERAAARRQRFKRPPRAGRPLRVGLLSAELGQHAVAYFLLPWLRALDPARVSLFLYPTKTRTEPQTRLFERLNATTFSLVGLSHAEAVARLQADALDVLVDTSGHTAHHRLDLIAHRSAPVQCHYIGYFATTGLSEMDWFIADPTLIPPALDAQFSERIWRLDRPWMAYAPLDEAPEPVWSPDPEGRIRIGSFNNLTKISADCLDLWARILLALPHADLLLKDGKSADPEARRRIQAHLARAGVVPERLLFAGRDASWSAHMAQYNRLDIALDPIPMTGGSTAFDTLWMGVPLVTLAGDRLIGRQGAAALAGLGRHEWITHDPESYVEKVRLLAQDVSTRREVRLTQRAQMRNSPLCDGVGMARALETAFEHMFDQWWEARRSVG